MGGGLWRPLLTKFKVPAAALTMSPMGFSLSGCRRRFLSSNSEIGNSANEKGGPRDGSFDLSNTAAPLLMLPPKIDGADSFYSFYSLAEKQVINIKKTRRSTDYDDPMPDDDALCVGSFPNGWLALLNPRDSALFLSNPISCRYFRLPCIPNTLPEREHPSDFSKPTDFPSLGSWAKALVSRIAISGDPGSDRSSDIKIMMIQNLFYHSLLSCRLGDTTWTPLSDYWHTDIIYSTKQHLFYVIDQDDYLEAWDFRGDVPQLYSRVLVDFMYESDEEEAKRDELISLPEGIYFRGRSYLAEDPNPPSGGAANVYNSILYIKRFITTRLIEVGTICDTFNYKTMKFSVCKLDLLTEDVAITRFMAPGIGDHALFLGWNHSFCLSARNFPLITPNSIYFTDDDDETIVGLDYHGQDTGVFSLQDFTMAPCFPLNSDFKNDPIQHVWFTPPPS